MYDQMNPQQQQGGFGFNINEYEAQAPLDNLPVGWYNVLISEAENEATSSGKGTACKIVYTVYGGAFNDRKVFDNLNFINENQQAQDIARRALRTIQDSIGKQVQGPWDLVNSYLCIKVGLSKPQEGYEQRNQVKGYKPFDQALHQQNQQPAAQQYNVQVQPGMQPGNGPMNMQQSAPQFAQQSMPQNMQPQGQMPNPQQFQQPGMPQQQQMQPQQAPQQFQQPPQQQMQPQQQPNNGPQQGNGPGSQPGQMNGQPGQAQNAPGATGQDGQQSQGPAAHNAQPQSAPPTTFAPQQGQQQMQPQNIPNPPQGQMQQLAPNPQFAPEQQQQQQQPQQQQNQQMPQPPQGGQQTGNTPPPPGNW